MTGDTSRLGERRLVALLEQLDVKAGDLVYLHTSFSRLAHLGLAPKAFLSVVLRHLGPTATLVLPCFTWHLDRTQRPWKGYADYYRDRPVFDVRHTAANIGVIPEFFRRWPDVRRSVHYWWSVAALGPLADEITSRQHEAVHPYGPDSAFGRMHAANVKIVGLGVSMNTTSLAPIADFELGTRHPQRVFSDGLEEGIVIDENGQEIVTRAFWLLPDVVRQIKPSEVILRSSRLHGRLHRVDVGDTIHFSYAFKDYLAEALDLAAAPVAQRTRVPWLEGYSLGRADADPFGEIVLR